MMANFPSFEEASPRRFHWRRATSSNRRGGGGRTNPCLTTCLTSPAAPIHWR